MPRGNIEKHLDFLVEKNFCGIPLSSFSPGAVRLDQLEAMAPLMEDLGWAILIHLTDIEEIIELATRIRKLSANILFDHLARVRSHNTVESPGFQTLLALLALLRDTDHCWAKICSW